MRNRTKAKKAKAKGKRTTKKDIKDIKKFPLLLKFFYRIAYRILKDLNKNPEYFERNPKYMKDIFLLAISRFSKLNDPELNYEKDNLIKFIISGANREVSMQSPITNQEIEQMINYPLSYESQTIDENDNIIRDIIKEFKINFNKIES